MQQQKVVSWLSQHNFPHGLVSFADGLSTDPLGHKAAYLNRLVQVNDSIRHCDPPSIPYLQTVYRTNDVFRPGTRRNNSSRVRQ